MCFCIYDWVRVCIYIYRLMIYYILLHNSIPKIIITKPVKLDLSYKIYKERNSFAGICRKWYTIWGVCGYVCVCIYLDEFMYALYIDYMGDLEHIIVYLSWCSVQIYIFKSVIYTYITVAITRYRYNIQHVCICLFLYVWCIGLHVKGCHKWIWRILFGKKIMHCEYVYDHGGKQDYSVDNC